MGATWSGHVTATGETFDAEKLTAAHPTLPLPSFLYVTNPANGRTVLLRVNDRVPKSADRVVAVSKRAARLLGFAAQGRAKVAVQYAGPAAAKVMDQHHEEAFLRRQSWVSKVAKPVAAVRPAAGYPRWDGTRRIR